MTSANPVPTDDADDLLARISVDPAVCGGKPCVRGTRIWVGLILGALAHGTSVPDVLAEYPQLEEKDVPRLPRLRRRDGQRPSYRPPRGCRSGRLSVAVT